MKLKLNYRFLNIQFDKSRFVIFHFQHARPVRYVRHARRGVNLEQTVRMGSQNLVLFFLV